MSDGVDYVNHVKIKPHPSNKNKHMKYMFKIKITAKGGFQYTYDTTPDLSFYVGCGNWVIITEAT